MNTSVDRERAARMLMRVEKGAFASRLLASIRSAGVRTRVLGVLRWLRPIDLALEKVSGRRISGLDPEVRATLRMGVFEAVVLGVPGPVAGDGAVHLIRRLGGGRASGLVNAVMRRAPREFKLLVGGGEPAIAHSHPEWIWRRWCKVFGRERAEDAMRAAQQPADLWVWFVDEKEEARFRKGGGTLEPHPWMPQAWRSTGRDLVSPVAAGSAYAQDPASQLVAHLVVELAAEGAAVVDLCSAPGGKVARMASHGDFSRVVAADLNLTRLALADSLFARVGGTILPLIQDAAAPALPQEMWDVVLLDAPCTGTGTLRRHPELRWRLEPGDVAERAALQRRLVEAATPLVAPGGVLLYSTCSIELEENEAHFIDLPEEFELVNLEDHLPEGLEALTTSLGGFRTMPQDDCDGFTVHALRRRRLR